MAKTKDTFSGNKGEWSEIYVFLRLLSTGKLNVADDDLKAVPNEFYKILEIIRKETSTTNFYVREEDNVLIRVTNDNNGEVETFAFPIITFAQKADELLSRMLKTKDRTHQSITNFLKMIKVSSIKDTGHKRDITIKIEDFHNGMALELGFSIKSFIGANSTLFNAGPGTNFIYRIELPAGTELDIDQFNTDTYTMSRKIKSRIKILMEKYNAKLIFEKVQSKCLFNNLRSIDGDLPFLLSQLILARYTTSKSTSIKDCTNALTKLNPLDFDVDKPGQVYEYKIKRFLHDCALGMTPETPWTGLYDATGGQIIVKKDGEIVCYHICELNRFLQFLFNTTKLEEAATSEDKNNPGHACEKLPNNKSPKQYKYGWLYTENDNIYIKLNLQVRNK